MAGTASGPAAAPGSTEASSTALVSSSMNSGTPSACVTIRFSTSRLSARSVVTRSASVSESLRPSRASAIRLVPARPVQGALKSGRNETMSRIGNSRKPIDQCVQQFERTGIGPLRILEQHQHGMASCHALQPALQCSKGSLLALLRVEFRLPVAITGRHRQHGGNRRDVLRRHTRRRDNGLKLAQTRLVRNRRARNLPPAPSEPRQDATCCRGAAANRGTAG